MYIKHPRNLYKIIQTSLCTFRYLCVPCLHMLVTFIVSELIVQNHCKKPHVHSLKNLLVCEFLVKSSSMAFIMNSFAKL